jgi:hypothetical protein
MSDKDIPQIIKDVGFDFHWAEEKVWALKVTSEATDIRELIWHFEIPFLREDGIYNLKPWDVIKDPSSHSKEYDRTLKSNLNYPIDIMENKGRWLILDGLHRLMKAYIQGQKVVKVRKISRDYIPQIVKE